MRNSWLLCINCDVLASWPLSSNMEMRDVVKGGFLPMISFLRLYNNIMLLREKGQENGDISSSTETDGKPFMFLYS